MLAACYLSMMMGSILKRGKLRLMFRVYYGMAVLGFFIITLFLYLKCYCVRFYLYYPSISSTFSCLFIIVTAQIFNQAPESYTFLCYLFQYRQLKQISSVKCLLMRELSLLSFLKFQFYQPIRHNNGYSSQFLKLKSYGHFSYQIFQTEIFIILAMSVVSLLSQCYCLEIMNYCFQVILHLIQNCWE